MLVLRSSPITDIDAHLLVAGLLLTFDWIFLQFLIKQNHIGPGGYLYKVHKVDCSHGSPL